MPQRIIAIGDIHGCATALRTLLDAIQPGPEDVLVPLGDYIDRGPDSKGVIDTLIELQSVCTLAPLLGNHEEMLFTARLTKGDLRFWLHFGGDETLQSYGWEMMRITPQNLDMYIPLKHLDFLRSCQAYYETDSHFFIHANYAGDRPLEQQPQEMTRWVSLHEQPPMRHVSGKTAIVGHTAQVTGEVLDLGFLKCIDTYCHGGMWLTALDVLSGQLWQANDFGQLRER
jgi:serine/threonine protein phosphatase 1